MNKIILIVTAIIIATFNINAAQAADSALELAQRWDAIKYQTADKDARIAAYESMIIDVKKIAEANSNDPIPKVWGAIALATLGGEVGAMGGALDKVTQAKALLEAALQQSPSRELETSIHTTLGSLYYQVPGWPIGFGDDDEAVKHLNKALALSPDSLAANFWMGSYLWEETRQRQEAGQHFIKAMAAPARAGRDIADQGRKAEAAELLAAVEKKLKHKILRPDANDQASH